MIAPDVAIKNIALDTDSGFENLSYIEFSVSDYYFYLTIVKIAGRWITDGIYHDAKTKEGMLCPFCGVENEKENRAIEACQGIKESEEEWFSFLKKEPSIRLKLLAEGIF